MQHWLIARRYFFYWRGVIGDSFCLYCFTYRIWPCMWKSKHILSQLWIPEVSAVYGSLLSTTSDRYLKHFDLCQITCEKLYWSLSWLVWLTVWWMTCKYLFLSCMLQKKLGSYLAPFLNGMRYTSFGRHFTKVDKLKEVSLFLHFIIISCISVGMLLYLVSQWEWYYSCIALGNLVFPVHSFSNWCSFKTNSIKLVY